MALAQVFHQKRSCTLKTESRTTVKVESIWNELRNSDNNGLLVVEEDFGWLKANDKTTENFTSVRILYFAFAYSFIQWNDMIDQFQKKLVERCGHRMRDHVIMTVSKLEMIQKKDLLISSMKNTKEEIETIWKEICDRCVSLDETSHSGASNKVAEETFTFDLKLQAITTPEYDVCVAFANNGSSIAKYVRLISTSFE